MPVVGGEPAGAGEAPQVGDCGHGLVRGVTGYEGAVEADAAQIVGGGGVQAAAEGDLEGADGTPAKPVS